MEPFPKAYELISFFEGEPSVLDPGIPWAYNALRFETVVGEDRIACDLEPGMCAFMIRWNRGGVEVLNLDLHGFLVWSSTHGKAAKHWSPAFRIPNSTTCD